MKTGVSDMHNLIVSSNIRSLRKRAGKTQKQLAEAMGVTEPFIRAYESGRRHPKLETVARFASALECTINDIIPLDMFSD